MDTVRFNAALVMLDDARHLLGVDRWASAISRAVDIAEQVCKEIQQRSGGLSP